MHISPSAYALYSRDTMLSRYHSVVRSGCARAASELLLHRATAVAGLAAPAGLATLVPSISAHSSRALPHPTETYGKGFSGSDLLSTRGGQLERHDVVAASTLCRSTYRYLNTRPEVKAVADLDLPAREPDPSAPQVPAKHPGSPSKQPSNEESYLLMVRPAPQQTMGRVRRSTCHVPYQQRYIRSTVHRSVYIVRWDRR